MTSTSTQARPTVTRWDRRRDKYGRTTHVAITAEGGEYGGQSLVGAVVSMPKVYREAHPGQNVMVNLWDRNDPSRVYHFESLADAKRFFAANAMTRDEHFNR